jgi:hypothetical protein
MKFPGRREAASMIRTINAPGALTLEELDAVLQPQAAWRLIAPAQQRPNHLRLPRRWLFLTKDAHHPRNLAPMPGRILAIRLQVVRTLFSLRFSLVTVVADHAVRGANEGVMIIHASVPNIGGTALP